MALVPGVRVPYVAHQTTGPANVQTVEIMTHLIPLLAPMIVPKDLQVPPPVAVLPTVNVAHPVVLISLVDEAPPVTVIHLVDAALLVDVIHCVDVTLLVGAHDNISVHPFVPALPPGMTRK